MAVQNLTHLPGVDFVRGVFIARWPLGRLYFPTDVVGHMKTPLFENLINSISGHMVPDLLIGKTFHKEVMPDWTITMSTVAHCEEPYVLWKPDVGDALFDEWVVTSISSKR